MAQFQHHPDNLIYVRGAGATYSDTPANFAADLGQAYEFTGRERLYEPGVRHFVDGQPQPLDWAEGDAYIAALDALLAAQVARLNPAPTLDQARANGIATLLQWRGEQRAAFGLSEAKWQELAYIGKAAHCRDWLSDQTQPFALHREALARGLTDAQLAALVVAQNTAWLDANDQIDAAYAAARGAIEAAQSVAEIEAVLAGL